MDPYNYYNSGGRYARRPRSPPTGGASRRSQGTNVDYGPSGTYRTRPAIVTPYRPTSISTYQDAAPPPQPYGGPPPPRPLISPTLSGARPPKAPEPPLLDLRDGYGIDIPAVGLDRRHSVPSRPLRREREERDERERPFRDHSYYEDEMSRNQDSRIAQDVPYYDDNYGRNKDARVSHREETRSRRTDPSPSEGSKEADRPDSRDRTDLKTSGIKQRKSYKAKPGRDKNETSATSKNQSSTSSASLTLKDLKDTLALRELRENLPGSTPGPPSSLTTLAEVSPAVSPPGSRSAPRPATSIPPPTSFPPGSSQSHQRAETDEPEQTSRKQLVRFNSDLDRAATASTPPQIRFQSDTDNGMVTTATAMKLAALSTVHNRFGLEDNASDVTDVQSLVEELRDKSTLLQSLLSQEPASRGPSPSKKAHRLSTGPAMRDPSTIIYRLSCKDLMTQEELLRYSTTPFEGFIESHDNTREQLAPMDVMLYIQGNKLKDRKSQHRSTFGTLRDPDPEPFVVGEDFFARIIDPTYIRILSPQIQNVLRKLVQYYPGHDLQGRELLFKEPYRVLVHYHDDLHEVAEAENSNNTVELGNKAEGSLITVTYDETTQEHLNILLNSPTYKDHYDGVIEPELRNYEEGYASYDKLWLLFKPGDTVFARVRKDLAGFVVLAADHTPDPYGVLPLDKWTIQVWNLAYTGQRLTRQAHEFTIDRYNGLCKIDELNIFPKRFLRDDGNVEKELIARGTEYFNIVCGLPAHRRYSGSVIANHLVQYNGEIMVDPSGYLTYAPKRGFSRDSRARSAVQQRAWQPIEKNQIPEDEEADFYTQFAKPLDLDGGPRWSKFNDMVCNERNIPTPDQLLLFSSHVLGFALQRKEWMIFEMKYVYPVDEDKQAMKRVVLEPAEREMLMGMIGDDSIDSWNAEFIEGKGRGQVILLYGHPGTGKTFTVECVAKHTNRPLLSLTVADLGTEETTMEAKLAKWLDRATSWNGIVLIDEADIYLERREKEDLSRNSLVTAFLRTMEYYSGTMFLTTNRPGAIDPAFTSRIHLFLGYKTLTPSSRPQVWDGFFNKLEREQRKLRPGVRRLNIPSSTQTFAKNDPVMLELSLNGREIRNILQSAINLARYHARGEGEDEIDITADLLRKVVENRTQYKNAIKAIDGLSESARAHDSGWIAE